MKLNLQNIFDLQAQLDKHIHSQHNVTYATILQELKLALIVELAETANEIRSFKFWSVKGPSAKDVILEEYADGIHFITALCIAYKANSDFELEHKPAYTTKKQITDAFIQLFVSAATINDATSAHAWYKSYLEFGLQMNFDVQEIIKAYEEKCKINHQRQEQNY